MAKIRGQNCYGIKTFKKAIYEISNKYKIPKEELNLLLKETNNKLKRGKSNATI